jgi:hypothetical protein
MRRRIFAVLLGVVLATAGLLYGLSVRRARLVGRDFQPTFAFQGDSSHLTRTQVVATLDAPMEKGKNVIWSASFQAAWKKLQRDVARGPVELEGAGGAVDALNQSEDRARDAPPGSLYTAAGWENKGILDQIDREVKQAFPDSEPPTFPGIVHGSFVAYSRLEARLRFGLPYFQSKKPLAFTAGDGSRANVSSFGVREEDDYAYRRLREQPRVLYSNLLGMGRRDDSEPPPPPEFAVDLDSQSAPSQIIVAMVAPGRTLAETLATVEERMHSDIASPRRDGIGINDVLLVPDIVWRLTHHFGELEGKTFRNPSLKGQRMDVAQEDLVFRLDRSGAEVRAESKNYCLPVPTHYVFNRPFLVLMRKRGETRPYFVMWVDNAELLTPMK